MRPSRATMLLLCAATAGLMIAAAPAAAQKTLPDITVTSADNGKEITVRRNQRLIVQLANPLGTAGYGWSALLHPLSPLRFADKQPAPPQPKQAPGAPPMVGVAPDEVIAFSPARYTESSSYRFMLIYCRFDCDLKDQAAKIFTLAVTTKK